MQRRILGISDDLEKSMRSSSSSSNQPLLDHHQAAVDRDRVISDDARLQELGYKQELSRSLSAISNFAVTFSIISVLTGITTLFNMGLAYGGPVTIVYGWPIVGTMTMIVGLSMAEICSAFPTSAGLYFWSARLCGNHGGPFASWITGWYVAFSVLNFLGYE